MPKVVGQTLMALHELLGKSGYLDEHSDWVKRAGVRVSKSAE